LIKDLNCSEAILQVFKEFIISKNIKNLLLINKRSKQFEQASAIKQSLAAEKSKENNNSSFGENLGTNTSNYTTIEKEKIVKNLTSFDESNLESIGKFYNIFNEIEYIREECMKIFKQVIIDFGKSNF